MLAIHFLEIASPQRLTLFPYTTLFRSPVSMVLGAGQGPHLRGDGGVFQVARQRRVGLAAAGDGRQAQLPFAGPVLRSEEHTSELQSLRHLVCRLLLEKKDKLLTKRLSL